ncbi:Disintegrin and metalloproteinase domain-containing protein 32 [Myotis davidii]|uniref:Disintegrin and metalloproteinase domain-containing protein 32 n=1 Tax=Myotis davidii TaxID=225400 RepID=L5LQW6_MYODS|nr:Disintegrin and metalloproteinase domain-containing protein 32 [Myotis davidii]
MLESSVTEASKPHVRFQLPGCQPPSWLAVNLRIALIKNSRGLEQNPMDYSISISEKPESAVQDFIPLYLEMHIVVDKVLVFAQLNVTIVLSSLELWSDKNKISTVGEADELLQRFLEWKKSYLTLRPHDIAYLFMQSSGVKTFSNCSLSDFKSFILNMGAKCLQNKPQMQVRQKAVCGNGKVENPEVCDCGTEDIQQAGSPCRPSVHPECDLPEFCNGSSSACPTDIMIINGHSCKTKYICYNGDCHDLDARCESLFGKGSKNAPFACYEEIQSQLDRFGNCGKERGQYKFCQWRSFLSPVSVVYSYDKYDTQKTNNPFDQQVEGSSLESYAVSIVQLLSLHMGLSFDNTDTCYCSGDVCTMSPEAIHLMCGKLVCAWPHKAIVSKANLSVIYTQIRNEICVSTFLSSDRIPANDRTTVNTPEDRDKTFIEDGTSCGPDMYPKRMSLEAFSVVIAQLLGVNLGLSYDDINNCNCPGAACIMNPQAIRSRGVKSFSSCSVNEFKGVVSQPGFECLQNQTISKVAVQGRLEPGCGNKRLDFGEECDCGPPEVSGKR